MARTKVTIDEAAMHQLLYSAGGPIGKHMTKVTLKVHGVAKIIAPVDSGQLRNDISWKIEATPRGPVGRVYNRVKHALYVHEGTRAHVIRPTRAKLLAFKPRGSGRTVFAKVVHHPGTRANRYLRRAVEMVKGTMG